MLANLEVYELVTANDYALIRAIPNVRVIYADNKAHAHDDNGAVVAALETFDDDPVQIQDGCLKIEGVLVTPKQTKDGYGFWVLRMEEHNG